MAKNERKNTACPGGTWSDVALISADMMTNRMTEISFRAMPLNGLMGATPCRVSMRRAAPEVNRQPPREAHGTVSRVAYQALLSPDMNILFNRSSCAPRVSAPSRRAENGRYSHWETVSGNPDALVRP